MEHQISIFDTFGGIRPMARTIGEPVSTVAGWKRVGRIPAEKQPLVLSVAKARGLPVSAHDVVFPTGEAPIREPLEHHSVPNGTAAKTVTVATSPLLGKTERGRPSFWANFAKPA